MLKPDMMRIFVAVAETGGFTTASNALGIPKATVSEAIQKLESDIGTRLLQRTTRKVTMTTDGLQFLERCKDLLLDLEEAENMFQTDNTHLSGRIRVDMPTPIAKSVILPALPEFIQHHPGIEVEISSTDRRVDLVREGFDFVIRAGGLGDSNLIAKKIGEYEMGNFVSSSYIKKYGTPKNLQDLSKHYQVHYVQSFGGKPDYFEYFNGTGYSTHETKALVTVNSVDAFRAACFAGLGIIQAPVVGMQEEVRKGRVKRILIDYIPEPLATHIVYPHRRHLAKRVRVFMDWAEIRVRNYILGKQKPLSS